MKLLQVDQRFPPAFRAKEKKIVKHGIFAEPHARFAVTARTQQPFSLLLHLAHLPVCRGRDQGDLPRFAVLGRFCLHIFERDIVDLRKKVRKFFIRQYQRAVRKEQHIPAGVGAAAGKVPRKRRADTEKRHLHGIAAFVLDRQRVFVQPINAFDCAADPIFPYDREDGAVREDFYMPI